MFYLMTHSTHFIYRYIEGRKENVLFNDALNTFYLRLYGRKMFYLMTHSTHFIYGYMASDIWLRTTQDSERGNPLPPHGLLFTWRYEV